MRSTTGRHHRRPRAGLCGHRLRRTCRNSGPTKSSRRSASSSPGSPGRRAACAVSWCTARCNESMSMPREKRDSRPGKKPWPPVRERPQGPCQNHARHRTHRNREHERIDTDFERLYQILGRNAIFRISGEALVGYAMVPALLAAGGGQDRSPRARPRATPVPGGPGTRPARRRGRRRQP